MLSNVRFYFFFNFFETDGNEIIWIIKSTKCRLLSQSFDRRRCQCQLCKLKRIDTCSRRSREFEFCAPSSIVSFFLLSRRKSRRVETCFAPYPFTWYRWRFSARPFLLFFYVPLPPNCEAYRISHRFRQSGPSCPRSWSVSCVFVFVSSCVKVFSTTPFLHLIKDCQTEGTETMQLSIDNNIDVNTTRWLFLEKSFKKRWNSISKFISKHNFSSALL